jgi:two-component system, OmpR family, sensor histidine kinase MprB
VSLRTRLVLVATAAVAAAVVLASALVYILVRNELRNQVDDGLRAAVSQIHLPRFAQLQPGPHPHEFYLTGPGFNPNAISQLPFRLIKSDGTIYLPDSSGTTSDPLYPVSVTKSVKSAATGATKSFFISTHIKTPIGTQHVRVFTTEFQPGYSIQVAASLNPNDSELAKIRLWLILVALGGIGLASAAGFVVARAALIPVRRLSAAAEDVRTTRDLTKRIEVTGNDELSHLARTFNAMLESLDDAANQQRQLVQDASHELRTPLTSLRTNIEMLASKHRIPAEERAHMLSDVVAQLTEMTALIGELTELARGEEQHPVLEEVRVDLIAEDAIRRTTRNHPDVPIDAELAPTVIVGTPATLERAVANLLDNAAKWSPAGSRIDVRLTGQELTVRDHGPGIAEDDLPHIFDRFYRATSARSMPGSGLGLAIVKQVAEAHGGTITAESAPDGGTVMRLTFGSTNGAVTSA